MFWVHKRSNFEVRLPSAVTANLPHLYSSVSGFGTRIQIREASMEARSTLNSWSIVNFMKQRVENAAFVGLSRADPNYLKIQSKL